MKGTQGELDYDAFSMSTVRTLTLVLFFILFTRRECLIIKHKLYAAFCVIVKISIKLTIIVVVFFDPKRQQAKQILMYTIHVYIKTTYFFQETSYPYLFDNFQFVIH